MQNYTMTEDQYQTLIKACQPVPMIVLQCGSLPSQQENANAAWKALGEEMGFDYMTVSPVTGEGDRIFRANPITNRKK